MLLPKSQIVSATTSLVVVATSIETPSFMRYPKTVSRHPGQEQVSSSSDVLWRMPLKQLSQGHILGQQIEFRMLPCLLLL